eukprot:7503933-Heterocapsa_arctica.AAC.1
MRRRARGHVDHGGHSAGGGTKRRGRSNRPRGSSRLAAASPRGRSDVHVGVCQSRRVRACRCSGACRRAALVS